MPLLFKLFDIPTLIQHRASIFDVFDQEFNLPDLGPNKNAYATKRCLKKVLEHPKCKESNFTEKNTIMIDSEIDKVKDYPLNSVVLKPYD